MPPPRPGPTQLASPVPAREGTEGADRHRGPDQAQRQARTLGCSTWCPAAPGRSTPTGCVPAGTPSPPASAPPRSIRSAAMANAIRDELDDATAVLDAFHVVRLGMNAMEECRRRVQQEQLGHRGRKHDPLYRIRNALRAGADRLTARQIERIEEGLQAGDPDFEVTVAWRCYQQLRSAFHTPSLPDGRAIALSVLESFPNCPIPEIARLGRTLRAWKEQFLAYFTTGRASNGGTEAINGIIELHRRIARGFRNPARGLGPSYRASP